MSQNYSHGELQVTGVNVLPEGIELAYINVPCDLLENGVIYRHSVLVPREGDYEEEIEAVEEALLALLADVLEDSTLVPHINLDPEDEDDDDEDVEVVEAIVVEPTGQAVIIEDV